MNEEESNKFASYPTIVIITFIFLFLFSLLLFSLNLLHFILKRNTWYQDALLLRRCDDTAKDPNWKINDWTIYKDLLFKVAAHHS